MKIKDVCEQTGLTDRAVRHYIACGLLVPAHKENYVGRKNFSFSEADVDRLKTIKVLRDADFSIEQICALFEGRSTNAIVKEHLEEIRQELRHDAQLERVLQSAALEREVSLEELQIILSSVSMIHDVSDEEPVLSNRRSVSSVIEIGMLVYAFLFVIGAIFQINRWVLLMLGPFCLCVSWLVLRRTAVIPCVALITLLLIGILVSGISGLIFAPHGLTDSVCEAVAHVSWQNELFLEQCGFEKQESGSYRFYRDDYTARPGKGHSYFEPKRSRLRIVVRKADSVDRDKEHHPMVYGTVSASQTIVPYYDDLLSDWLQKPSTVSYHYSFIVKDMWISVDEYTVEPSDKSYFEFFLSEITSMGKY